MDDATRADGTTGKSGVREVVVVANANASGSRRGIADRAASELERLGATVELRRTRAPEEMAAIWSAGEGRRIVLVGGDGTLHSAVNLPGPPPDVALVPAGGANNVAHSLGIPLDPVLAARTAVMGTLHAIDLIECRSERSRVVAVEGISVGFLALARARYHSSNSADVRAAIAAAAAAFVHFHPMDVRVVDHGMSLTLHIGQLFVANMASFGTGLRVAPHAEASDGLLDVVALDISGRRAVPAMLAHLRRGTHEIHPGVREWRTEALRIETRGRSPIMADTEDLGPGPVDVRAMPGAIRIAISAA